MTDEEVSLETATGQNVPLSDLLGFVSNPKGVALPDDPKKALLIIAAYLNMDKGETGNCLVPVDADPKEYTGYLLSIRYAYGLNALAYEAERVVRDMERRPPHQQPPWMRADPAAAPAGMLFLPQGAKWAEVDAELYTTAARYLEKAKLARASAKRYRARGDLLRWRKACAVARVWEMAHKSLWMVACPF